MTLLHNYYYLSLLGFFAVVAYMIYVDRNVADYIVLMLKTLQVKWIRAIFWVKFYPRLQWETFLLKMKFKRGI